MIAWKGISVRNEWLSVSCLFFQMCWSFLIHFPHFINGELGLNWSCLECNILTFPFWTLTITNIAGWGRRRASVWAPNHGTWCNSSFRETTLPFEWRSEPEPGFELSFSWGCYDNSGVAIFSVIFLLIMSSIISDQFLWVLLQSSVNELSSSILRSANLIVFLNESCYDLDFSIIWVSLGNN